MQNKAKNKHLINVNNNKNYTLKKHMYNKQTTFKQHRSPPTNIQENLQQSYSLEHIFKNKHKNLNSYPLNTKAHTTFTCLT